MDVGIGLPATIPGVEGRAIVDWAMRADRGPFSSLGVLDRLVYPNFESMVVLGAAAAVTGRIGLMTTILLAPLRSGAMLAKQAASVDAISEGRLTLGLGIGGRPDDFIAGESDVRTRGRRFEDQLATIRRVWFGKAYSDDTGPIGPAPSQKGGPDILIGATTPTAMARIARWGDGFIAAGGDPDVALRSYQAILEDWKAAGRKGKPRFVAAAYFALGPDAASSVDRYINDYYGFMPDLAGMIAGAAPSTPERIRAVLGSYADVGVDEFLLWPCNPGLDQVDRLAEVI